jgi:predicted RNA-binding protein associated with RNAse of E/G family
VNERWQGHGVLMLQRPEDAYAVWVFWFGEAREFRGWYVNLQERFRRTESGYDTQDHELDIWVTPDGAWEWKDDELLDVRVEEERFTPQQAESIRAEGRQVVELVERREQWWDDAWAEWQPDSGWDADVA